MHPMGNRMSHDVYSYQYLVDPVVNFDKVVVDQNNHQVPT